ncbi:MAG: tetratricopeptide repeat protein [Psychromonas sp.]|nr:tetratricopeptide repeat protein [Alteromonadales bacterium]MCP5079300.1 tetratricopeptide repeat protein [Psychromonas sp.]
MYYIKIIFQSLLLLTLIACSSKVPVEKESETDESKESSQSTKIELTVYTKALIALNNNELDKAQKLFTEMSKLQPDIAGSWANLALINVRKEQYDEAERLIKIALQKNPKMVQALNLSGSLEQQKGNIIEAKSLYKQALTYNPNYALANYNLALVYDIYLQDIPKAITHYQRYLVNIKGKDEKTTEWLQGLQATIGDE